MTQPGSDPPEGTPARLRRDFFESVHDAILVFRPGDEVVLDVNRHACELYRIPRADFIGRSLKSMTVDVVAGEAQIAETVERGHTRGFESVHVRPDGTRMFLEINAAAIDLDGQPAVMSVNRDVTERRRVERALRHHAEALELAQAIDRDVVAGERIDVVARRAVERLLDRIPDGRGSVVRFDRAAGVAESLVAAGRTVVGLPSGGRAPLAGWTRLAELEREPVRYIPDIDRVDRGSNLEALRAAGLRSVLSLSLTSHGEIFGELSLSAPVANAFDDDHVRFARAIADELAVALREAQLREDLEAERERLAVLVDHLPEGVVLLDGAGRPQLANATGRELLAVLCDGPEGAPVTVLAGRPLASLASPGVGRVELVVEGPVSRVFEIAVRAAGASGGHVVVVREATLEHEMRARLREHDRLAAVGRLAAGIAHDFNNLLQVVETCSELALESATSPDAVREQLGAVLEQTRRGAQLIRQVLDFSRRSVATFRPVDLGALLVDVTAMLRHSIPESVRIELDVAPGLHVVRADATQIHQLVTNLALNARDAMGGAGTLRIAVEPEGAAAGAGVRVRVSDDGSGIPPEVLPHVFEPFFTTKRPGEGTGLGLSQVYGIVQQHEGSIEVDSVPGVGTTFVLQFPPCDAPLERPPDSSVPVASGHQRGVLVVEDDAVLRRSLAKLVANLGYRTLTAADGAAGVDLLAHRRQEIDVVLTDLVMPGVGGVELCRRVRELAPDLPVVVMSGYPLESEARSLAVEGITEWISKPFSREKISAALARALGGPGSRPPGVSTSTLRPPA